MPEANNMWEAKLYVLLHDPLDKIFQLKEHEEISGNLRSALGLSLNHLDLPKQADVIASASDRNPLISSFVADWVGKPEFYHPLDGVDLLSSTPLVILRGGKPRECDDEPYRELPGGKIGEEIVRLSKTPCILKNGVLENCPISVAVRRKLEELRGRFHGEDFRRKQFLYLWRTLDTSLVLGDERNLTHVVSFLPADSRIPDHGIVDHLVTSTALVPALLRNERISLVSIDIGGVGKFLSHSRKVRDIWASSYLISLLTLLVTRIVAEELGPDSLIFPDVRGNPLMDLYLLTQGVLSWDEVLGLWGDGKGEGAESPGNFFRKLLVPSLPDHVLFFAPEGMIEELEGRIRRAVESFFQELGKLIILEGLLSKLDLSNELREVVERQLRGLPYPLSLRMGHIIFRYPLFRQSSGNVEGRSEVLKEQLNEFIPSEIATWRYEVKGVKKIASLIEKFADMIAINEYLGEKGRLKYNIEVTTFYPIAFLVLQSRMRYAKLSEVFEHEVEPGSEGGGKVSRRCMLCGSRNPLFVGEGGWSQEGWRNLVEAMEKGMGIGERWLFSGREPLCAVGVLKRLLMRRDSLIAAWSVALGIERNKLEEIVSEGEKLSAPLKEAIGKIPTLDDVAVAPKREEIVQESNSDPEENSGRRLTVLMANALVDAAECRSKRKSTQDRRLSTLEDLIAELGRKYIEISEALITMREREMLGMKLASRLEGVEEIPGTLLFPSTWKNVRTAMEKLGCGTNSVDELIKFLIDRGLEEKLSNYVAIVQLDGDLVGKWISGMMFVETNAKLVDRVYCLRTTSGDPAELREPQCKFRSNAKALMTELLKEVGSKLEGLYRLVTPSLHRNMSSILRDLSLIYPDIVEEVGGITLYSAGDELLAAVPASKAVDFVERVIRAYRGHLLRVRGRLHLGMGEKATVSGGVVVAHRLIPMSEMLRAVSEELAVAKDGSPDSPPGSRNRVSFAKMTRGGHYQRAVISGDLLLRGVASSLLLKVRDVIQAEEILSRSFVKDFLEYMERFGAKAYEPDKPESIEPLVRLSIRRNLHGTEERNSEVEEEFVKMYIDLLSKEEKEYEEWHLGFEKDLMLYKMPVELERTQMIHIHRLLDLFIGEVLIRG